MSLKRNIAILATGFVTTSTSLAADHLLFISMSHAMPSRAERLVSEATHLANEELKAEFVRIGGISLEDGTRKDGVNRLNFVQVPESSSEPLVRTTLHKAKASMPREFDIVISLKPESILEADLVIALKEELKKLYGR